jgi:hypothetical protein
MKQTIYEEIQRIKLLSKYDNSKTLNEQVTSADINMDRLNKEQLSQTPTSPSSSTKEEDIANLFYDGASLAGTNPGKMFLAIKDIDNTNLFWKVNDLVKTKSGMDIAGVINDEYGFRNAQDAKNIVDHLKTIGINATYGLRGSNSMEPNSFKITTKPAESESDDTTSQSPYSKFPCVKKHRKAVKGKDVNGNDIYTINGVVYYGNGRKRLTNGTMSNYTCNDPEFKGKSKPVEIPEVLKDAEGVMKFQDWLDNNHGDDKEGEGEGWATGLPDGKLSQAGGYGRFGPRTQKAWKNPAYKDGYLKSLQTPTATTPDNTEGLADETESNLDQPFS